jgi:plastocyanin
VNWVRASLAAVVAGLMVLALTQTAASPPPRMPPTEPPAIEVVATPRPTRVPLPTIAEMIVSRVARETPTPGPRPTASAQPRVSIVDYGFAPAQLTIHQGATVTWTNSGSEGHDVDGNGPGGAWRSGPLAPAEQFQRTFPLPGTYDYTCSFHPEMRARVVVQP